MYSTAALCSIMQLIKGKKHKTYNQIITHPPERQQRFCMEGWLQQLSPKLTGKNRGTLRSLAHHLQPVVIVGQNGPTDALIAQVERALTDHELIKVKVLKTYEGDIKELAKIIVKSTDSQLAGKVGHILILYRENPDNPQIQLADNNAAKQQN